MKQITKLTGLLCLTAAALIVSSELLRLVVGLAAAPDAAASLTHTLTYGLALAGMYALLLALTALYVGHQRVLGTLGLVGYLTASLGTVLVAGDWWFEAFAVPMIGAAAPDVLTLPAGGSVLVGAMITAGLFAAGWIIFGVAVVRSGACGILALSTPYQVPLAVAVGWIGATLVRASGHAPLVAQATESPSSADGLPSRQHPIVVDPHSHPGVSTPSDGLHPSTNPIGPAARPTHEGTSS
jgi:hypothetical protein